MRLESRFGRCVNVAGLLCCLALMPEARGDELDFRVVQETRIAPTTSALPSRLPNFRVLGIEAEEEADADDLDFAVMGGPGAHPDAHPDAAAKVPTVYVYSENEERCAPCRRLKADFEAGMVPMRLEWRQPPTWVQAYPTLHWQDAAGGWRQWSGWPGANRFRQIHRNTDMDAQKKK